MTNRDILKKILTTYNETERSKFVSKINTAYDVSYRCKDIDNYIERILLLEGKKQLRGEDIEFLKDVYILIINNDDNIVKMFEEHILEVNVRSIVINSNGYHNFSYRSAYATFVHFGTIANIGSLGTLLDEHSSLRYEIKDRFKNSLERKCFKFKGLYLIDINVFHQYIMENIFDIM